MNNSEETFSMELMSFLVSMSLTKKYYATVLRKSLTKNITNKCYKKCYKQVLQKSVKTSVTIKCYNKCYKLVLQKVLQKSVTKSVSNKCYKSFYNYQLLIRISVDWKQKKSAQKTAS